MNPHVISAQAVQADNFRCKFSSQKPGPGLRALFLCKPAFNHIHLRLDGIYIHI